MRLALRKSYWASFEEIIDFFFDVIFYPHFLSWIVPLSIRLLGDFQSKTGWKFKKCLKTFNAFDFTVQFIKILSANKCKRLNKMNSASDKTNSTRT